MNESIVRRFEQVYLRPPHWIARAPGRVNLIGEHTDYNGGFVLPMAIERDTTVLAAPNASNIITLRSAAFDEVLRIDLTRPIAPSPQGDWSNYPKGVIAGFIAAGFPLTGFDGLIHSTVPLGGGLSSSAALEVALATLLEAVAGKQLDPKRKAALCREAEHRYAHVPCGIMDQFICTLAKEHHALLIDCRSQNADPIELKDPSISVLIVNTNVKHQLAASQYALRRTQCETAAKRMGVSILREAKHELLGVFGDDNDDTLYRRALHVLSEDIRTYGAARAMRERDWLEVGKFMYSSHGSLRDNFEVSCAELDTVVKIAKDIGPKGGVFGCRMTGGGFGGCAVALIQASAQAAISSTIAAEYRQITGIEPTLFASRPAQGASIRTVDVPSLS